MSVGSGGSAGRGPKIAHRGLTSSRTHLDLSSFSQLIQTEKETLNVISEPVATQGLHVCRRMYMFGQKTANAHSACVVLILHVEFAALSVLKSQRTTLKGKENNLSINHYTTNSLCCLKGKLMQPSGKRDPFQLSFSFFGVFCH